MGIIRIKHQKGFTVIPNTTLRDPRLSLKGVGLLCWLLSQPDGWEIRPKALQTQLGIGRESLRDGLNNLEEAGYLTRLKSRDQNGRWRWSSTISEVSQREQSELVQPSDGKPVTGTTRDGFSGYGLSGDIDNTEIDNTTTTPQPPATVNPSDVEMYCALAKEFLVLPDGAGGARYLTSVLSRVKRSGLTERDRGDVEVWLHQKKQKSQEQQAKKIKSAQQTEKDKALIEQDRRGFDSYLKLDPDTQSAISKKAVSLGFKDGGPGWKSAIATIMHQCHSSDI